jgi:hypothetical protein
MVKKSRSVLVRALGGQYFIEGGIRNLSAYNVREVRLLAVADRCCCENVHNHLIQTLPAVLGWSSVMRKVGPAMLIAAIASRSC